MKNFMFVIELLPQLTFEVLWCKRCNMCLSVPYGLFKFFSDLKLFCLCFVLLSMCVCIGTASIFCLLYTHSFNLRLLSVLLIAAK